MDATKAWKRKSLRFMNLDTGANIGKALLIVNWIRNLILITILSRIRFDLQDLGGSSYCFRKDRRHHCIMVSTTKLQISIKWFVVSNLLIHLTVGYHSTVRSKSLFSSTYGTRNHRSYYNARKIS